jgi:hypothetical protein
VLAEVVVCWVVVFSQRAASSTAAGTKLSHDDDDAPAASRTVQIIRLMLSILPLAMYIVHSLASDESLASTHMS